MFHTQFLLCDATFFIWYNIMGLMFYDDCEYVKLCEK